MGGRKLTQRGRCNFCPRPALTPFLTQSSPAQAGFEVPLRGPPCFRRRLFDFNGVLVNDEVVHFETFREVLAELGVSAERARLPAPLPRLRRSRRVPRHPRRRGPSQPSSEQVAALIEAKRRPIHGRAPEQRCQRLRARPSSSRRRAARAGRAGGVRRAARRDRAGARGAGRSRGSIQAIVVAPKTRRPASLIPKATCSASGLLAATRPSEGAARGLVIEDSLAGVEAAKAAALCRASVSRTPTREAELLRRRRRRRGRRAWLASTTPAPAGAVSQAWMSAPRRFALLALALALRSVSTARRAARSDGVGHHALPASSPRAGAGGDARHHDRPHRERAAPGRGYGSPAFERGARRSRTARRHLDQPHAVRRAWDLKPTGIDLTASSCPCRQPARPAGRASRARPTHRGLKVLLVPHLWVESGGWRAEIDPDGDAAGALRRGLPGASCSWARVAARARRRHARGGRRAAQLGHDHARARAFSHLCATFAVAYPGPSPTRPTGTTSTTPSSSASSTSSASTPSIRSPTSRAPAGTARSGRARRWPRSVEAARALASSP